jgi:hypothetical protein
MQAGGVAPARPAGPPQPKTDRRAGPSPRMNLGRSARREARVPLSFIRVMRGECGAFTGSDRTCERAGKCSNVLLRIRESDARLPPRQGLLWLAHTPSRCRSAVSLAVLAHLLLRVAAARVKHGPSRGDFASRSEQRQICRDRVCGAECAHVSVCLDLELRDWGKDARWWLKPQSDRAENCQYPLFPLSIDRGHAGRRSEALILLLAQKGVNRSHRTFFQKVCHGQESQASGPSARIEIGEVAG